MFLIPSRTVVSYWSMVDKNTSKVRFEADLKGKIYSVHQKLILFRVHFLRGHATSDA